MFLYRMKPIKGKSIDHPLGKLKDLPPSDRINELIEQLKAGHKYVIDELFKAHIKFAIKIASQYAIFMPSKAEDLISESMVCIMSCLLNIHDHDNFKAHLASKIHSKCARYINEDNVIKIPQASYQRHKLKLNQVPIRDYPVNNNGNLFVIKDLIAAAIKTEQERQIIELRSKCYVDREIANIIGLSTSRVAQIRDEVYERFQRLERV